MVRRRLAQGSSTGVHQLQRSAVRIIDAHQQMQEAAHRAAEALDKASTGIPVECDDEDSLVILLDHARAAVAVS